MRICSIDGCGQELHCKELCQSHYNKTRREINKLAMREWRAVPENKEKLNRRRQEQRKNNPEKVRAETRRPDRRYSNLKACAKRSGLDCEISYDDYLYFISKPCFYCNGPLPEAGRGLDRIDNEKGYFRDNVLSCCEFCNKMRGATLTVTQTYNAIYFLAQFENIPKHKLWEKFR